MSPTGFDRDGVLERLARTEDRFPRAVIEACLADRDLGREVVRELLRREVSSEPREDESLLVLVWALAGALADEKLLSDLLTFLELDDEALDDVLGDLLWDVGDRVVYAIGRTNPERLLGTLAASGDRPAAAQLLAAALVRSVVYDGFSAERVRTAIVEHLDRWDRDGFPLAGNQLHEWELARSLAKLGFLDDRERLQKLKTRFERDGVVLALVDAPNGMDSAAFRTRAQGLAREEFDAEPPLDPFMLENFPPFRDAMSPNAVMNAAIAFAKKTAKNRARARDARKQKKKARRK